MNSTQINDEIMYQITMKYVKEMVDKNFITVKEYNQINAKFNEKYGAKISCLFMENS